MFLKVIACEVAFREICFCAARSPNQMDLEFLSQGYHDNPEIGIQRIQDRIDDTAPDQYDAVLIGYGLCNNMLKGLRADATRLIVPRAHDCITFFLGSKNRYDEFFSAYPGTYYYTAGWLEYRERGGERPVRRQNAEMGGDMSYDALVEKYGEDNAKFLMETLGDWTRNYQRGVFIDFDFTTHLPYRQDAQEICENRNWKYEEVPGDLGLLQRWLDGDWNGSDFLQVEPGQTVVPSYENNIVQIENT